MALVLAEPGQVEDPRDGLALAEQQRVAAAVAALGRVELNEVCSVLLGPVDADGDAEHRVGNVEHGAARARGLSARMKPARSAPAAAAAATSSSRVRPQIFTSGRAISSASLAAGSGAFMRAEPTRIASAPASSAAAPWARLEMPLSATTTRSSGEPATSSSWRPRSISNVPRSRAFTPIGSAPSVTARWSSVRVVRLDERVEADGGGGGHQSRAGRVVEVAQDEQNRVGAGLDRRAQVVVRREEALREERELRPRPGGAEIVPAPAEALLVDQHRHRSRAGALVAGGESCRVGVRAEVAERGRAALHLGDRLQPRCRERIPEAAHYRGRLA